eukprot:CAMPEP_0185003144 /NCGR_PEP_ID=MMETSP1098-20130426/75741_1 /TAXON_ID=89044 /ORGANISM="Spumella elongata, Strain CCAP 955/1" /LENGTH=221 /DNA_ID=CAMNT_0027530765 /DNA_START=1 /DNA_END=666 /DNA_ORIENTATION=+
MDPRMLVVILTILTFLVHSNSFILHYNPLVPKKSVGIGRNLGQLQSVSYPILDTRSLKSSIVSGVSDEENIEAMRRLAVSAVCDLQHVQKSELSSHSALVHSLFKLYSCLDWAAVAATGDDSDMFSKADLNDGCLFNDKFKAEFQKLQNRYVRVMDTSDNTIKLVKPHHLWSTAKHRKLMHIDALAAQGQLGDGIRVGTVVFAREDLSGFLNATIDMLKLI